MQNATLSWSDPTGPMTGVELAIRIVGAPDFTVLDVVAKGVQTLVVPDLQDGSYEFRAVVVNGSKRSVAVFTSGAVESVPGAVSGLAVSFS